MGPGGGVGLRSPPPPHVHYYDSGQVAQREKKLPWRCAYRRADITYTSFTGGNIFKAITTEGFTFHWTTRIIEFGIPVTTISVGIFKTFIVCTVWVNFKGCWNRGWQWSFGRRRRNGWSPFSTSTAKTLQSAAMEIRKQWSVVLL